MATAELAVALPVVVLVLVVCLSAVRWGVDQVRCVDAARVVARELARGDPQAQAVAHGRQAAPAQARIEVSRTPRLVVVTVSAPAPAALGRIGVDLRPSAEAQAVVEVVPGAVP